MSTGKKVAGIIMSVIGGILLFMAVSFAIAFLAVGGAMEREKEASEEELENFYAYAVETEGIITSVDNGSTIVEFYAEEDDSYHQWKFPVSNSAFKEGDSVVVYYNRQYPASGCMAPDLVEGTYETLGTVFYGVGAGLGVFFGIAGLGLLIGGIVLIKKSKSS
ncbi:MAG: hypothetical protein HDR00_00070 [Lachnospiraceae bacterium]|nr:hypothetical protein [Lachnospiraceae bacterium]